MRHTYLLIAIIASIGFAPQTAAHGQLAELQVGARVRLRAPGVVAGRLEGTVIARSRDSVTVTAPQSAPLSIPLAAIRAADVSRGRSRGDGALKGLAWGTGIGLAMGLLTQIDYNDCGDHPCMGDLTRGEYFATSLVAGAGLGAAIGAIVGAEHWERLAIPPRLALSRSRTGTTVALALRF